jgi:hypothetical protein
MLILLPENSIVKIDTNNLENLNKAVVNTAIDEPDRLKVNREEAYNLSGHST